MKSLRHIVCSKNRAYCSAPMREYHPTTPGIPMPQRNICAKCLVASNAALAKAHGWKVKLAK